MKTVLAFLVLGGGRRIHRRPQHFHGILAVERTEVTTDFGKEKTLPYPLPFAIVRHSSVPDAC